PKVLVLGQATRSAWPVFDKVRKKIDDYFTRCALATFDPRAITALNREEKDFVPLGQMLLDNHHEKVAELPLSHVAPGKPLPFGALNPAWAEAMAAFYAKVVEPLLGKREALTEAEWKTVQDKLAPFEAYLKAKAGASVEPLGDARVRQLSGELFTKLEELVSKDKAEEPVLQSLNDVEKLVRCHRDLFK